ncbi:MAG: hypothetical protein RR946_07765 [Clostridia bacterium]
MKRIRQFICLTFAFMWVLMLPIGCVAETKSNSDFVFGIEVNQVMSYGITIDDGTFYAMESFVAGKETIIIVRLNEPGAALADGSQRLTVLHEGQELVELLPEEMDETRCLFFKPRSLADVGNWAAGLYTFRYQDQLGNEAERSVLFRNTRSMKVLAVPVIANYGGNVVSTQGEWKTAITFTSQCYPLAQGAIEYVLAPELDLSGEQFDLTTDDGMYLVWESVANLQTHDSAYELILGFVPNRQGADGDIQGYTFGLPANIITESDGDMQPTVAHEIAHCYSVGDEYPGGAINSAVNPAPYGMEGSDWSDRDITVLSDKAFVKGGNDIGSEATGTIVPEEQFPINVAENELLLNNVSSFMGSGSSNPKDYWITSAIWEQLYKTFLVNDDTTTTQALSGDPQSTADAQPQEQAVATEEASNDDNSLTCKKCGESAPSASYLLYLICSGCGEFNAMDWSADEVSCEYCETVTVFDQSRAYIICPHCEQLSPLGQYLSAKQSNKFLVLASAGNSDIRLKASAELPAEAGAAADAQSKTYRLIDFKGKLTKEGVFTASPFFAYDSEQPATSVLGDYAVEMYDAAGKLLSRSRFNASFHTTGNPPRKLDFAPINVTVNYPVGTAKIVLKHEDKELSTFTVSANAPEVSFVGLTDHQAMSGKTTVEWTGADADHDALAYELWYCTENGDSINLASGISETSLAIDFDTLPGCDNAYLYLFACDGTNTTELDSPYLSVSYKAPEILTAQSAIPEVRITDEIQLEADVYDMQDGWLYEDKQLTWSTEGREYATGSSLWVFPYELTPGDHVFTLTATNNHGVSTQQDYTYRVLDDESALPDDWSREDVKAALSNGFITSLKNVNSAITRGRYADLMAMIYYSTVDENAELPTYEEGIVTDCGANDINQFLMVHLGVMDAPDGRFSPNETLTEEQAMRILYDITIKGTGVDDGTAVSTEDMLAELTEAGVVAESGENAYQAEKPITSQLALVRCNRLYNYLFSE